MELTQLRTISTKTFDLGGGRKRLSMSQGVIHFPGSDGSWQDVDEAYSEADLTGYDAVFSKCLQIARIKNDGTRRVYPNRNDLSYYIDIGKPFASMGTPVKVGNLWIWDFVHATISVEIQSAAVKFDAILKDASAPTSMTIPFTATGITRIGAILYHNGVPCAQLVPPFALTAQSVRKAVTTKFRAGTITIAIDTTGLTSQDYPIHIDPTLNLQVAANNADCFVAFIGYWVGPYTYDSGGFALGDAGGSSYRYGGGLIWGGATDLEGATISSGTITVNARDSSSGANCKTKITGDKELSPALWTHSADALEADYKARRGTVLGGANDNYLTTAVVTYDNIPAWTANSDYSPPDVGGILQEIVDQSSWSSGVVGVWWDDHEGRSTRAAGNYRAFKTYGLSTSLCAKLDAIYSNSTEWGPISSSVNIGIMSSASKLLEITRSASVTIGTIITASKSWGTSVAAAISVGVATTASKTFGLVRSASVQIGQVVSASRTISQTVASSVAIGVAVSASKAFGLVRTAKVVIGCTTWVSRLIKTGRGSGGSRGFTINSNRPSSFFGDRPEQTDKNRPRP